MDWEQVKRLFHEALRDRQVLEGAPGEVRAEVEALLRAHEEAPLERAVDRPGSVIGRYKLLQQIGEGGFGVVFMAEQTEPVRRKVALKLLKAGMDTGQVVARFEAERQALALMDHGNIAKVLDAGATSTGRPYFVMELVKGVPITEYCDEAQLDTKARLALFVQVCSAVQHAHQKGIIHRDLKPSNVLVTLHDGDPVPKVIDFGIAKAIDRRLTEKTLFTEFRQMIGTPEYMAPEQAELSGLDVDTRADIYSLGVLLYELLTGTKPFDLRQKAFDEMLRTIRETDPQRPSTRVSTMGEALVTVAGKRRTAPQQLGRVLRGDLDWIVMKALEKDRSRRYETANGLASDIRRHLADEPVLATPAGASYRLRKYARRHRVGVAAAAVVLAALVLGGAASFLGYVEAAREAAAAEQARTREAKQRALADAREKEASASAARANRVLGLVQEMLSSADPHEGRGPNYTVRQVLDDFDRDLAGRLQDQPEVEATVRVTIGRAYLGLGLPDRAEPHLKAALDIRRRVPGEGSPAFADALEAWASLQHDVGRYAAAGETMRRALEIRRRLLDPRAAAISDSLHCLADYAFHEARYDEAERLAREEIEILRARGAPDARTAAALDQLAKVLLKRGDTAAADSLSGEALAIARRVRGDRHPTVAALLLDRGDVLRRTGDLDGAEALARESLSIRREFFGDNDGRTAMTIGALAAVLWEKGDRAGGEATMRESVSLMRKAFGADHPDLAGSLDNMGELLRQSGDLAGAEPLLREALAIRRKVLREGHPGTARTLVLLARLLAERGSLEEAEALGQEALTILRAGDDRLDVAQCLDVVARVRLQRGDPQEAEALAREALTIHRERPDQAGHFETCLSLLSDALRARGDRAGAEAALVEAIEFGRGSRSLDRVPLERNLANLAKMVHERGDDVHAVELLREAVAICRENPAATDLAIAQRNLGSLLYATGDSAGAEASYREVVTTLRRTRGEGDLGLADALFEVGNFSRERGALAESEACFREGISILRKAGGVHGVAFAKALLCLGTALMATDGAAAAEETLRESAACYREALGPKHPETVAAVSILATVLSIAGKPAEAEATCRALLEAGRSDGVLAALGMALAAQGKHVEAETVLRECLALREKEKPDSWLRWSAQSLLGGSIAGQGRHAEAEPLLLEAYAKMQPPEPMAFPEARGAGQDREPLRGVGKAGEGRRVAKAGGRGGPSPGR